MCIYSFCNNHHEDYGWFVKAPWTTNGGFAKHAKTIDEVFLKLRLAAKEFGADENNRAKSIIPYVMIQPCMRNRREYKIVCLNRVPIYITSYSKKSGRAFGTVEEKLAFAKLAIEILGKRIPFALLDGLIRVDIFINAKGEMVVNEFEGFEAGYADGKHDLTVEEFLSEYWEKKILKFVYGKE